MIQRIQNLYLLILILINLTYLISHTYKFSSFPTFTFFSFVNFTFYIIPIFLLLLSSLIMFKRRKKQLLLNRINIFFNLIMIIFSLDRLITLNHLYFIIIANLFFLIRANRGIKNDEELINSIDRIR